MNAKPTTPPPHRISDTPPVFPCWLYNNWNHIWSRWESMDMWHAHEWTSRYTHWHPDQPEAPTARPEQETPGHTVAPDGKLWKPMLAHLTAQPAPTAAGTPITDGAEFFVANTTRLSPDEGEMHIPSSVGRFLETKLQAAQAEVAQGLREAVRLAEIVWKAHYRNEAPNWKPLGYVAGVVSQIDNMYAGLRDELVHGKQSHAATLAKLQEAMDDKESMRLKHMAEYHATVNERDDTVADLRTKLTAAEQEIAYDNAVVDDLKTRLETAEQSAEHWQTEWRKQEEAHRLAEQQVAELQTKLAAEEADVRKCDAIIDGLNEQVAELTQNLALTRNNWATVQGIAAARSDEVDALKSDLATARRDTEHAQYWIKQLIESLPAKRDWLNPDIESNLKAALHPSDAKP